MNLGPPHLREMSARTFGLGRVRFKCSSIHWLGRLPPPHNVAVFQVPLFSLDFPDNNYTSIHFTFSIILCTASSSSQLILSFDLSPHLIFDLVLCRNPLSKTCSLISSASYCRQFGHFVLFLTATATTTATCFMSNLFSQELLCNLNWFNGNWLNSRRRNEKFCIR